MGDLSDIYRCEVCGHIIEVLRSGVGQLVCCNQKMTKLESNSVDAAAEKHVPVVEYVGNSIVVRVGSVEHPMTPEHYIMWIEILSGDKIERVILKPGDRPEAKFEVTGKNIVARAYCNLHGLWQKVDLNK
jgi:superoxide reductase